MGEMTYPKINSYYKRDKKGNMLFDEISEEIFGNIKKWVALEKVDGTNWRVIYDPVTDKVTYNGRTDRAQVKDNPDLCKYTEEWFTPEKFKEIFDKSSELPKVILFGEGYGKKIQKGGGDYISDKQRFILFDVVLIFGDKKYWLERLDVIDVANKFKIPTVPIIEFGDIKTIEEIVKNGFLSKVAENEKIAEGVVCETSPLIFNKKGNPIKWKIKYKDFHKEEKKNV